MPTPEEWRQLRAEWTHDYGLRHLEDRGVRYEDEAERPLDHATGGGGGDGQEKPAGGVARRPFPKLALARHLHRASGRHCSRNRHVTDTWP